MRSIVNLDIQDANGRTALDLAAFKGHGECVESLVMQGATILVHDSVSKRTPLHAAGMVYFTICAQKYKLSREKKYTFIFFEFGSTIYLTLQEKRINCNTNKCYCLFALQILLYNHQEISSKVQLYAWELLISWFLNIKIGANFLHFTKSLWINHYFNCDSMADISQQK